MRNNWNLKKDFMTTIGNGMIGQKKKITPHNLCSRYVAPSLEAYASACA